MGGPNRIFAWGKRCRTAVARTWAEEWRSTSSACGSLSVRIATFAPSGSGRPKSQTVPFTRTARAAFASPGPIAFARSAPVEPAGTRFSLPSGSTTRISGGIRSVGRLTGRGGSARQGRQVAPVAEVERDGKRDHRGDGEPTQHAVRREHWRLVGHRNGILAQTEGWWRTVEVVEVLSIFSSTNLHSPPPTSTNLSIIRNDRDALRAPPPVRPARRRAPPLPAVARARRVHGSGGLAEAGLCDRDPPAQRDGRAAHGPGAQ